MLKRFFAAIAIYFTILPGSVAFGPRTISQSRVSNLPNYQTACLTRTSHCKIYEPLNMAATGKSASDSEGIKISVDLPYAVGWVALIFFAAFVAPGTAMGSSDSQMLDTLINDPLNGGDVNRLWFVIWNYFTIVPATLASLMLPNVKKDQWLPAGPFAIASAFIGYFGLGPYFALRNSTNVSSDNKNGKEFGFITTKVLDNRLLGALLTFLALEIPFTTGLVSALQSDAASVLSGFAEILTTSRFVSVATVDLTIMIFLSSILIYEDLIARNGGVEKPSDKALAALTLVAPGIGAALYLALRPSKVE